MRNLSETLNTVILSPNNGKYFQDVLFLKAIIGANELIHWVG